MKNKLKNKMKKTKWRTNMRNSDGKKTRTAEAVDGGFSGKGVPSEGHRCRHPRRPLRNFGYHSNRHD